MKNIYIFGLGAAGSNILLNLIYSFPEYQYHVIDFDIVETRNIVMGTQPYSKSDLNRPKVQAISRICKTNRSVNITMHNIKIVNIEEIKSILEKESLIIDCFDNAESRNLFCSIKGHDVLHVGFSGDLSGAVLWDENFAPMKSSASDSQINICEFAPARSFIMTLTGLASLSVISYLNNSVKNNFILSNKNQIVSW